MRAAAPLSEVMDQGAFDLKRVLEIEPNFLTEDDHEHDDTVGSVSLQSDRPVIAQRFEAWMSRLLQEKGTDIFRSKGILDLKGNPNRMIFQGVHMLIEDTQGAPWRDGEPRSSRLVFIGRDLDGDTLRREFEACLA